MSRLFLGRCGLLLASMLLIPFTSAGAQVLLEDTFDAENGGTGVTNYTGFANWTITDGTVDLIGSGFFDFYPGNGLYVDLDGSSGNAGRMESSASFALTPGTYRLDFELGGSTRNDENTVVVSLGSVYSESFTLPSDAPLALVSRTIVVGADETAVLAFDHAGGDNSGLILDDVLLLREEDDGDDTPPVCSAVQLGDGPFSANMAAFVTAQDPESGIAKLTYKLKNAQGFFDTGFGTQGPFGDGNMVQFDVPIIDAITIGGEKVVPGQRARVVVLVENAEGGMTTCDPVMTTVGGEQPTAFRLERAYPNPFNPSTTLGFAVPEAAHVELAVYDVLGRRVATLVNESVSAGRYEVQWDGRSDAGEVVAGGVYLARLTAGRFVQTQQLTLMK